MLTHRWVKGNRINGREISSCPDCGTLRVVNVESNDTNTVEYQRAIASSERITLTEPPCIRPPRRPAPW